MKSKINIENKFIDIGKRLTVARGMVVGGLGEKMKKGLRSTDFYSQNSSWNII